MTTLRTLAIAAGTTTGLLLLVAMDALPWPWLIAVVIMFLASIGLVWATSYATRNQS